MITDPKDPPAPGSIPRLHLLGTPHLAGVRQPPPRSARRCLELITFIGFHPGATVTRLADTFDATRASLRWAIVQARQWLGSGPDGELHLPLAYTGGYHLSRWVSVDLADLLQQPPPTLLSNTELRCLLELSRGPAFAGEPAGSWVWAEQYRIAAAERLRDDAHELASRALHVADLSTARWAAAHGLDANPEDELLLTDRLRAELAAGAAAETIRLAERIRRQADRIGIPPMPDTAQVLRGASERSRLP